MHRLKGNLWRKDKWKLDTSTIAGHSSGHRGLVCHHTQDTRETNGGRCQSPASFTGSDNRPAKNSLVVKLQDKVLFFLLLCAHLLYPDNPQSSRSHVQPDPNRDQVLIKV